MAPALRAGEEAGEEAVAAEEEEEEAEDVTAGLDLDRPIGLAFALERGGELSGLSNWVLEGRGAGDDEGVDVVVVVVVVAAEEEVVAEVSASCTTAAALFLRARAARKPGGSDLRTGGGEAGFWAVDSAAEAAALDAGGSD